MIDRTVMRTDVGFLRRRPHKTDTQASRSAAASTPEPRKINFDRPGRKPQTSTAPQTGSLNLSTRNPSSPPAQPVKASGGGLNLSRPEPQVSAPQPSQAPSGVSGLSLGGSARTAEQKVFIAPKNAGSRSSLSLRPPMDAELPKHSVPYFHNNTELSLDKPAVRLDFRQSAIGSMVIAGPQAFAWEMQNRLGGIVTFDSKGNSPVEPPLVGGRRIIEFYKGNVIVGLRHASRIRRIVFASQTTDLRIKLYDGSEIFMPSEQGKNVLLLTRIGHELEFRMEAIHSYDLLGTFSIKASQVAI